MSDRGNIQFADTATLLGPSHASSVVVCGSHGGAYPGCLAARTGVRGVVFNDAGFGKDGAGIGSLAILDALMIPAAVADYRSARIGIAADMFARGVISMVNDAAAAIGCAPNERVAQCAERMTSAELRPMSAPACAERRLLISTSGPVNIWALDSASKVLPEDSGAILITGSHGGLVGGVPATALKARARLAVFNDAGVGADQAGIRRLEALATQHIAAATVSAMSARIGDGLSTYEDGVISFVNGLAELRGARPGMTTRELVAVFLES